MTVQHDGGCQQDRGLFLGMAASRLHSRAAADVEEVRVQRRQGARESQVGTTELGVVQRHDQGGLELVEQAHHRPCLRQRSVEPVVADREREDPLDLLVGGRPEAVLLVGGPGAGRTEPALVEPEAVGIDTDGQVPGEAEVGAHRPDSRAMARTVRPPTGSLGWTPARTRALLSPWPTVSSPRGSPCRDSPNSRHVMSALGVFAASRRADASRSGNVGNMVGARGFGGHADPFMVRC